MRRKNSFCRPPVSSASVYASVNSVTVGRPRQNIGCYIPILNIQRTSVKLISLWSSNYEEHANGFTKLTPLFSTLNKPKQEA